jgi:L-alanine-DL-glutamate epimerase-like enolase superfamily enzyme
MRRAGGPTALLQVGMMADGFRIPYASHAGNVAHLSVLACLPNTMYMETGLMKKGGKMTLTNGCIGLPAGPEFDWE